MSGPTPPPAREPRPGCAWELLPAEIRAESAPELQGDLVWRLVPERPRQVLVLPLRTAPGVTLGSAIWRKPQLLAAIRGVVGIGEVRLSPIGGTIGPGGASWLSLLFVARLPDPFPQPLDQLLAGFITFLGNRLAPWNVPLGKGRVEGAWCPGFSDITVEGRKLAGLGFKLTREAALVRAIIGVRAPAAAEIVALDAAHRTLGGGVALDRLTWLGRVLELPDLDSAAALRLLVGPRAARPEKISS